MPDMGSIEGSVEAFGGGVAAGFGDIEASMSSNNGGGISDAPQVGTLDLDPNVIGQPIAVMDSRVSDPAPAFVANVTNADAKALGTSVMLGAAATAAVLTAGPTAGPLTGAAIISAGGALEALAHAAMDAQQAMGMPGAFVTDVTQTTVFAGGSVELVGQTPPSVLSWEQINPSAAGGGGAGG